MYTDMKTKLMEASVTGDVGDGGDAAYCPTMTYTFPSDVHFISRFKLATAVAIISNKPCGVTGEQYARLLFEENHHKVEHCVNEMTCLEEKVVNLQMEVEKLVNSGDIVCDKSENLYPTPPINNNVAMMEDFEIQMSLNTRFYKCFASLQTFLTLSDNERMSQLAQLDVALSNVFDNIKRVILQPCDERISFDRTDTSFKIMHNALQCIIKLANYVCQHADLRKVMVSHIDKFVDNVINCIVDVDPLESYIDKEFLVEILKVFTNSRSTFLSTLDKLFYRIFSFSDELRLNRFHNRELNVVKFESFIHVMMTCQSFLRSTVQDEALKEEFKSSDIFVNLRSMVDDSLLHLISHFPAYCYFVWTLQDLVAEIYSEKGTPNKIA